MKFSSRHSAWSFPLVWFLFLKHLSFFVRVSQWLPEAHLNQYYKCWSFTGSYGIRVSRRQGQKSAFQCPEDILTDIWVAPHSPKSLNILVCLCREVPSDWSEYRRSLLDEKMLKSWSRGEKNMQTCQRKTVVWRIINNSHIFGLEWVNLFSIQKPK